MFIKNFIKEWKTWRTVRKVVKQHKADFYEIGFDQDWLGRLYTLVNIPDEIVDMPVKTRKDYVLQNMMIDNYIKESLTDVTELLNELRLSDLIAYPDKYQRFQNTDTILLVLSPERRYTKLYKTILLLVGIAASITGLTYLIIYLISLIK